MLRDSKRWYPYPLLMSTVIFVFLIGVFQFPLPQRTISEPTLDKSYGQHAAIQAINHDALHETAGGDAIAAAVKVVDGNTNEVTYIHAGPVAVTEVASEGSIAQTEVASIRLDSAVPEDPNIVVALNKEASGIEIIDGSEEARERLRSYLQELELRGLGLKNTGYIIIKAECPILSMAIAHTTDHYGMHLTEKYILDGRKEGVMGILVHEDAHNGGADELRARRAENNALIKLGVEHGWCNVGIQRDIYSVVVSLHPEYALGRAPVDESWSEKQCLSYL